MLSQERRNLQTYLDSVGPFIPLSREEEIFLAKRIEEGDQQAYEKLIIANLRLVAKEAFRFRRKVNIDILDLIQEGNRGLIRAVKKFDYRRGNLFSTYAVYWIRAYLNRYCLKHASTVRTALPVQKVLRGIGMESAYFYRINGREPTLEELADSIEMPIEKIKEVLMYKVEMSSLDKVIYHDENNRPITHYDRIADDSIPLPDEVVDFQDVERIHAIIRDNYHDFYRDNHPHSRRDTSRDLDVYFRHLGGETLRSIGEDYNVTRERIRQIYERAEKNVKVILVAYGIYPECSTIF